MLDGEEGTYWESQVQHNDLYYPLILHIKPGVCIKRISLLMTSKNTIKTKIRVFGVRPGEKERTELQTVYEDRSMLVERRRLQVLDAKHPEMFSQIMFHFLAPVYCSSQRIHDLEIIRWQEDIHQMSPTFETFNDSNISKYPLLQTYNKRSLSFRAIILRRIGELIDLCLSLLVLDTVDVSRCLTGLHQFKKVSHILPLSTRFDELFEYCLKATRDRAVEQIRLPIRINWIEAVKFKESAEPSSNIEGSTFHQVYKGLLHYNIQYRFGRGVWQWWVCELIGGFNDHGVAFRDTLCDISEELCPQSNKQLLPFFIASPNQVNSTGDFRDTFAVNPSCQLFGYYEWIGKLMGCCVRSNECLVLPLSRFYWKKLTYEETSWTQDFATVDSAEVEAMSRLQKVRSEEDWMREERTWSVVLSDGSVTPLLGHQVGDPVQFSDREKFVKEVRRIRMAESQSQLDAIRRGLIHSIPAPIFEIITSDHLERAVTGKVEITTQMIKSNAVYKNLTEDSPAVRYLYEALDRFTSHERGLFVRFITGRQRPPFSITIDKSTRKTKDKMPTALVCSSTLCLPAYSSVWEAESNLRLAVLNCQTLDAGVDDE